MNIHEYQAKNILHDFGITVQRGQVVETAEKAREVAKSLGGNLWILKAQIHAGGRGKGGGVKLARTLEEVYLKAQEIIGMQLVTPQTGPEGQRVKYLYVVEGIELEKEFYLSLLIDRQTSRITFVATAEGGVEIEEITDPEKIRSISIDPTAGFQDFYGRQLAEFLGFKGPLIRAFTLFSQKMYQAFVSLDASLLEVNPLVLTPQGEFLALDAKMSFDENALFRHPQLQDLRDLNEEDPLEIRARDAGLNYIKLDGNIACMVNGAGLAMATMDLIQIKGGQPANFLDVGGSASKEQVVSAFKILLADKNVEAILVNIFGGIMHCDVIAQGIVDAAREVSLDLPLVVRLAGTNVDLGYEILQKADLGIRVAKDFSQATQEVVTAAAHQRG